MSKNDPQPQPEQLDPERDTPAPDASEFVNLPALLSDEFGVSRSEMRRDLGIGSITIDGEPWEGDRLNIPRAALEGKELFVRGEVRSFSLTYTPKRA